jgi:tRNA(Ile2) C34 agmatinyltransferase TiaS
MKCPDCGATMSGGSCPECGPASKAAKKAKLKVKVKAKGPAAKPLFRQIATNLMQAAQ